MMVLVFPIINGCMDPAYMEYDLKLIQTLDFVMY